jgi:cytochrome c oxidase subunit 5b
MGSIDGALAFARGPRARPRGCERAGSSRGARASGAASARLGDAPRCDATRADSRPGEITANGPHCSSCETRSGRRRFSKRFPGAALTTYRTLPDFPNAKTRRRTKRAARCFATFPGDDKPALDIEHATGLELKELQAMAEGKDFFDHYAFLKAPNGTKEAPVVVTSSMPYRIVGATDPDDDSIVHWGRVEAGKPPIKIGEEWFVHKAE